jgi:membrane fusion protein, multidrug efflux system
MDRKTATKSEPSSYFTEAEPKHRRAENIWARWWLWLAAICAAAAVLYVWTARGSLPKRSTVAPGIPVSASAAKSGDLDIYLSQIGAVTPFATVTIRSRVAGQILKIDFTEGQMVEPGQLLLSIDPSPYRAQLVQYEGQLARDRATLANARITLERYRALLQQGVIARQDLDNQRALYDQARGAIENDQGLIDAVKVNLSYCRITSPIRGRIGLRQVDLGNYVQPTDALVVVTQLQPISVIFSVPEDDIPEIVKDMSGSRRVPVEAWNRDFSKQLATGSLLTFDNEIDPTTGTVKLRAEFDNDNHTLFPNEFVNARLLVKTLHNRVLVATAAVQRTQEGAYVYVVQPAEKVERRPVVVGATQGDVTAIEKGLDSGEVVVTDGLDRLQPGNRVAVRMDNASSASSAANSSSQNLGGQ